MLLLGVFLIPITVSSLRGLTHVLTCDADVRTPFTVDTDTATSSARFERGDPSGLCGGLQLNMAVGQVRDDRVRLTLPITNTSEYTWKGSVELRIGGYAVPVDIGEIEAGATEVDSIDIKVDKDATEINGSLLIGP